MLLNYLLFPAVYQFELKLPVIIKMGWYGKFLNNMFKF